MKNNLRMILYVVAAGLIFILWQRWQQINQPIVPDAQYSPSVVQNSSDNSVPALPANGNSAITNSTASASTAQQIVQVKTDVLDLQISTKGATVVGAELLKYPTSLEDKASLALVHENNPNRMILASGLVASQPANAAPTHLSQWSNENRLYTMAEGQDTLTVPFTWKDENGIEVKKTFTFHRGKYEIEVNQIVNNNSAANWKGMSYGQIAFGDGQGPGGLGHVATFTGAVMSSADNRYDKIKLKDIASIRQNDTPQSNKYLKNIISTDGWVAMIQHYFIGAIVPRGNAENILYTQYNPNNGDHIIGVKSPMTDIAPGQSHSFDTSLYIGPKIAKNLEAVSPYLDKTVDYGILFMISQFMFNVMAIFYSFIGNWGWSIVVMTLLIKLVFFVPSAWAYKSMAKMRALQPEMTRLRERYGDDRQGMSRAVMELYKKEKVNPASGCLPMLLQIPFFIAFYYMLAESVELRQAPWILWIHDLSVKDPYFVLPIINMILMFVQQRLNPPPTDPMQQKVMMMLPLIFGFMFMWFPSGLVLYWTVSNAFGIIQQWVMIRRYGGGHHHAVKS
ncbi:membrane protein insertase YidC [Suttonella ornithocola]|uniref:Membrane protein insertase YidC n=1 Tax=Suttonella ornithocola TaxID=279832 RepID=A0A380N1E5_9GAMM|nr:membrane protein insertase YidC [Suttonella ornithocola]SUO97721.1 Oxa1Ec [Suttonella ornithocola]